MPTSGPPSHAPFGTAELCPGDIRLAYDRLRSDECPALPFSLADEFTRRYTLLSRVACGGMGVVWQARDRRFDRVVAVKLLRPELAARPTGRSRFLREARLHARIAHPAVVPVYDTGETPDGVPYLVMEYVDGRPLDWYLARPGVRQARFADLLLTFRRVCQATAAAHALRVLHRDLKPHNVMITRGGKVKLIDWGLATELSAPRDEDAADPNDTLSGGPQAVTVTIPADPAPGLTCRGASVGTPGYMSPEQARGEFDRVDERTDVFGLGAVLCEMLTGRAPLVADTVSGVWRMTRDGDLADARERLLRCRADVRLVRLCLRCLTHSPLDRPRDALAVLKQLPRTAGSPPRG